MIVKMPPDREQAGSRDLAVFNSSGWRNGSFVLKYDIPIGYYRMRDDSCFGLAAGTFDDPEGFRLASKILIGKKPGFYGFADETHKFTEMGFLAEFNRKRD